MNPPLPCLQATRGTGNCLSYLISDAIIYIHVTAWLADMLFYETVGLKTTDLFGIHNESNNRENLGMESHIPSDMKETLGEFFHHRPISHKGNVKWHGGKALCIPSL
jgi:hypothetical protein